MRISAENLKELSPEQQEKLRSLWIPMVHDVVLHDEGEISVYDCFLGKNKLVLGEIDLESGELLEVERKECLPLLSIGQLIQLLQEKNRLDTCVYLDGSSIIEDKNICDLLFQALKEILEGGMNR